jgi:hypothetical protein
MAPDSDLGMSYMYSLFNYVPAGAESQHSLNQSGEHALPETGAGLQIYPEIDRTLIAISAVSVITRLALDLHDNEVSYAIGDRRIVSLIVSYSLYR